MHSGISPAPPASSPFTDYRHLLCEVRAFRWVTPHFQNKGSVYDTMNDKKKKKNDLQNQKTKKIFKNNMETQKKKIRVDFLLNIKGCANAHTHTMCPEV